MGKQDLRVRASIIATVIAAGAIAIGISSNAVARGSSVTLPETSQGQLLDDGKVPVAIDPSKAGKYKTSVSVFNGDKSKKIAKAKATKVPKDGKTVKAKLTKDGEKALQKCNGVELRAKAKPTKGNGSLSGTGALSKTWGPCVEGSETPSEQPYLGPKIKTKDADRCDFLDPAVCLQPFPNDYFTVADGTTETGRASTSTSSRCRSIPNRTSTASTSTRPTTTAPTASARARDHHQDPWAREPGGVQRDTALVPITDMHAYDDADQPVVVINADTGERQPIWAELDANPRPSARATAT